MELETSAAEDLQHWFEVLPESNEVGWMGGDSDVSVVIGGGSTGSRALWIFADSFISRHDGERRRRCWDCWSMPHSTVALSEIGEEGRPARPRFFWRRNDSGCPEHFFEPSAERVAEGELLWPIAGLASRDGASVLLVAQRIKGFMEVRGTALITIPDVVTEADPTKWAYSVTEIGTSDLTWFSSIFFAEHEGPDDMVYLFGHQSGADGAPASQNSPTVLARAPFAALAASRWSGAAEYWTEPGVWSPTPEALRPLGVPSWETTCTWSPELGMWYSFSIPTLSYEVFLHTAREITGEWSSVKVHDIPERFRRSPWICYAAKSHPELVGFGGANRQGAVELIFTWICNALEDPNVFGADGGQLFKEGEMCGGGKGVRGYWPQFSRVWVRPAAE